MKFWQLVVLLGLINCSLISHGLPSFLDRSVSPDQYQFMQKPLPGNKHSGSLGLVDGKSFSNLVRYLPSVDKSIIRTNQVLDRYIEYLDYQFTLEETSSVPNIVAEDFDSLTSISGVWDQGFFGQNITVGVIDTGVDETHPALVGKVESAKSFVLTSLGYDVDEDTTDNHGHGTAVASLIAGNDSSSNFWGTGFGANLISAKVASSSGVITPAGLLSGLDWLIYEQDVDLISISLSEPEEGYQQDIYEQMVNEATDRGIIVVTSAGNRGSEGRDPFTIGSPGSSPEAITVGSVTNALTLSSFSSEGPTYGLEMKPDILAPGDPVRVARSSDYTYLRGTSFSAPIITGIIASILSYNQSLNPGQIKAGLLQSASTLSLPIFAQGAGMVNASAFLDKIKQSSSLSFGYNNSNYKNRIPSNIDTVIPVTLISSEPIEWQVWSNVSITSVEPRYLGYTSVYDLIYDFSDHMPGEITVETIFTSPTGMKLHNYFSIEIAEPAVGKVLLDLSHTIWDSVLSATSTTHLERLGGVDISPLQSIFEEKGYWVEELMDKSLDQVDLFDYDLLWMPSTFVYTNPSFYDRETQYRGFLTSEEVFSIYNYYANGGNVLADFAGTSRYDRQFDSVLIDQESLFSLLSLVGTLTKKSQLSGVSTTLASYFGDYIVPSSNYGLSGGFSISLDDNVSTSIFQVNEAGGQFTIFDSRNWRTGIETGNNELAGFQKEIINNIFNPLIPGLKISSSTSANFKVSISNPESVSIDFETININGQDVEFSQSSDADATNVEFNANENDNITLSVQIDGKNIAYSSCLDLTPPQIDVNYYNQTNRGSKIHFKIDEFGDLLKKNIRISTDEVNDINFELRDQELIVDLDQKPKVLSLQITLIDIHGNYASYTYVPEDLRSSTIVSSSKASAYLQIPLPLLMILVLFVQRKCDHRLLPS